MNITINSDNVLFKNELGEYHLSIGEFNKLGHENAITIAESEILKKLESNHSGTTINFDQARELGFCKYGIEDFATKLKLDISKEYSINELNKKLTIEALTAYPDECVKLFGKDTLKYLGGVKRVLNEDTISLVLRPEFIPTEVLHKLSMKFAYSCLGNFEKEYPNDNRPRLAIEAKRKFLKGEITEVELDAARLAARSAASSAARSAYSAAESAARSAASSASSAAYSAYSAAESAAWSAASSAARSAAKKEQVKMILEVL